MMFDKDMLISDRYRIIDNIGSGGMSEVYKAIDEIKKQTVALKVLKKEFSENQEFLRRFNIEAQAVNKLSHSGTVRQYGVGNTGDIHYIVLEYVEGKTLKDIIKENGALDRETAIKYTVQICETLNNAHQKNIIHRDVKAQNVMVDRMGRIKVMDFGIARFMDSDTVTFAGENVLGSVHYISPEQAKGEAVDASSDIYSLGILLYEMLTSELPFDGESTVAIVLKQLQQEMPNLSETNPEIGKALSDIVIKATQKDKKRRFSSLLEMRKNLLRAEKEPNGNFVKIKDDKTTIKRTGFLGSGGKYSKIINIALISIFAIGVIATTSLIISTRFANKNNEQQNLYIPQLLGKFQEEAAEKGEDVGFVIVLRDDIPSAAFPHGQVAKQEPEAGTIAKIGDAISIYISSGPSQFELPDLTNIFVSDATGIASESGLLVDVEYEISPLEEGSVLNQIPEPGTYVEAGDHITLWVSGEIQTGQPMPSSIGNRLNEAIDMLQSIGFSNIKIYYVKDDGSASGIVKEQDPPTGEFVLNLSSVKLYMIEPRNFQYYYDYVNNITIDEENSVVRLTSEHVDNDMRVETVWLEKRLPKGVHSLPVTIGAEQGGELLVRISLDGNTITEETIELKPVE